MPSVVARSPHDHQSPRDREMERGTERGREIERGTERGRQRQRGRAGERDRERETLFHLLKPGVLTITHPPGTERERDGERE